MNAMYYHSTDIAPENFNFNKFNKGIHFGNKEQAIMRRNGGYLIKITLKENQILNFKRTHDSRSNWQNKIKNTNKRIYDGLIYLNRYEGINIESILCAENKNINLDKLTDKEFKKHIKEASESIILFNLDKFNIEWIKLDKKIKNTKNKIKL